MSQTRSPLPGGAPPGSAATTGRHASAGEISAATIAPRNWIEAIVPSTAPGDGEALTSI
ncbi:MAG: hypothetical protein R3F11_22345 [Verrucomicrobiales bacterium]